MDFGNTSEIIVAVASVVTALSIVIAAGQLKMNRENLAAENARLKKQAAIEAAKIYINNRRPETDLMLQFVNSACHIDGRIIQDIGKFVIPTLPASLLESIRGCLEFYDDKAHDILLVEDGLVTGLTAKHVIQLQWIMIDYMNTLEASLMYWWQGTANTEILEKEFGFIINSPETARPVSQLLQAIGASNFPAVSAFIVSGQKRNAPEPTP